MLWVGGNKQLRRRAGPEMQRMSDTYGIDERPIRDMSDVLLRWRSRCGVFEVRNEEIALHIHEFPLTKRGRLMLAFEFENPIGLLPSTNPRENLPHDVFYRYFTLDVCECCLGVGRWSLGTAGGPYHQKVTISALHDL